MFYFEPVTFFMHFFLFFKMCIRDRHIFCRFVYIVRLLCKYIFQVPLHIDTAENVYQNCLMVFLAECITAKNWPG